MTECPLKFLWTLMFINSKVRDCQIVRLAGMCLALKETPKPEANGAVDWNV